MEYIRSGDSKFETRQLLFSQGEVLRVTNIVWDTDACISLNSDGRCFIFPTS